MFIYILYIRFDFEDTARDHNLKFWFLTVRAIANYCLSFLSRSSFKYGFSLSISKLSRQRYVYFYHTMCKPTSACYLIYMVFSNDL